MNVLVPIAILCLSTVCFSQESTLDTITFNHCDGCFLHGPGKGKIVDTTAYTEAKKYVYYGGEYTKKVTPVNWILIKDHRGFVRYEGQYLDHYRHGPFIEYDKMGRKISEGKFTIIPDSTVRIKRQDIYVPAHSVKVGEWVYYEYKNYLDTVGTAVRRSH